MNNRFFLPQQHSASWLGGARGPWPLWVALLAASHLARAAEAPRSGPEAARAQLQSMTVADGLEVTLFASEPMLRNPTNLDIDARGRVWITEGVNYRVWQSWGKIRPDGDRIVILADTDGDGTADQETTFYQGHEINAALGLCVLGEQVIVSRSPDVFVFTDQNHDDKADGPPRKLFTGIGGVDHDHGVHAFVFGPDGRLYFNFGDQGKELRDPQGTQVMDLAGRVVINAGRPYRKGMVFRCDLDGGNVETLAWNFRNPYEVAVDSLGTLWQSDNDDDGNFGVRINYVMEFGNFGYVDEMTGAGWPEAWKKAKAKGAADAEKVFYEWHQGDPGVVPNLLHTGAGSPTGLVVYEGQLLPELFHNQLIHCDAGPRAVRAYRIQPDGAGYTAQIKDILTSTDTWFRPSDVCVAPDGSLYVTDWNDAGVGGHNMADRNLETMTGRVYRIAPKGHRPTVPPLDVRSADGAIAALKSPNQATRYLAWRKLAQMEPGVPQRLVNVIRDEKDARLRARALWLLCTIKGLQGRNITGFALHDPDPDMRLLSLRIARRHRLDVIPFVQELVTDPAPQVRRECAIALRHNPSPEAPKLWAKLAAQHDGKDRWYLEALGIGADQQWDTFLAAWLEEVGDHWNTPAGRDIIWRSRSKQTPALLAKIVQTADLSANERDRFMRAFDFLTGPEKEAALVELLTSSVPGK